MFLQTLIRLKELVVIKIRTSNLEEEQKSIFKIMNHPNTWWLIKLIRH